MLYFYVDHRCGNFTFKKNATVGEYKEEDASTKPCQENATRNTSDIECKNTTISKLNKTTETKEPMKNVTELTR